MKCSVRVWERRTEAMTFKEQLNEYISALACSAKELAEASGLSESVISRYRSGIRVPEAGSVQLEGLVSGICLLAGREKACCGADERLCSE